MANMNVMKWKNCVTLAAAGAFALATLPARGIVNDNKAKGQMYKTIVDRNPFGLKDPPPVVVQAPVVEPPAPPPVEILLTGIATIVPPKRAFLMAKDPNKKDPYYSLSEGQGKDGIEVLQIDEKAKTVKIRQAGKETVLTFAANGRKSDATAPGPIPGQPGVPGQGLPPGFQANFAPPPSIAPGAAPGGNFGYNPSNPGGGNIPARTIPSRSIRGQNQGVQMNFNSGAGAAPVPQEKMPYSTVEEQYLMLKANELQQQKAFQKGLVPGPPPPLPPL